MTSARLRLVLPYCAIAYPRYNSCQSIARMTQHMQPFNRFIPAAAYERSRLYNISDKGAVIERFKSIIGL